MACRLRTTAMAAGLVAAVAGLAAPATASAQSCTGLRELLSILLPCHEPPPGPPRPSSAPDPGGSDEPDQPLPAPGKRFGFNSSLALGGETTPERELGLARAAGANVHRVALPWRTLQPQRSDPPIKPSDLVDRMDAFYAAALARGITPIVITGRAPVWATKYRNCRLLDLECARIAATNDQLFPDSAHLDAYRRYVKAVKERWPGVIIESWNTPNLYWGKAKFVATPEHFAAIQCAAYRGSKAVNDQAVLAAGWATHAYREYVGRVYAAGGAACWDAANLHVYPGREASFGKGSQLARVLHMARLLRERHGDSDPIWVTETGFTTRGSHVAVDEQTQADGSRRLYNRLVTMEDVGAVVFHTLRDPLSGYPIGSSEYGFGFIRSNWTPKPVYCGFVARAGRTSEIC